MEKEAMGLRIPCFREFSEYIESIFKTKSDREKFFQYCGDIARDVLERIHNEATQYGSEYKIRDVRKTRDGVIMEVLASNVSPDKLGFTCEIRKNPNSESDFLFSYY